MNKKIKELEELRDKQVSIKKEIDKLDETKKDWETEERELKQKLADVEHKLRHNNGKIPFCPSCGKPCTRQLHIMYICDNFDCEDHLTEWEWFDNYHGGLRRH